MVLSPSLKRSSSVAGLDDEQKLNSWENGTGVATSGDCIVTRGNVVASQSPASFGTPSTPISIPRHESYAQSTSSPTPGYLGDHVSQPTPPDSYTNAADQSDRIQPEVCFGMLVDVLAAPLRKPVSKETLSDRTGFESSWAVAFRSEIAILIDPSLAEVGQLDIHHSSILSRLKKRVPSLRCEVFLTSAETSKSDRQSLKNAFEAIVNLYGFYADKDQVGAYLEDDKVYLQEPLHLERGILYSNPHVFTTTNDNMTPVFGNQHDEKRKMFASAITSIMHQSITFHDNSGFRQDDRIKSRLNAHQVNAVKFAMSRENASLSANVPTLWHKHYSSLGAQFRHSLTKVLNSHPQNECRGGLLADEMGMGKTLSMLSLIIHSLHDAHEFAQNSSSDSEQVQAHLGATLIVTPKSTIDSWMQETQKHLNPDTVPVIVYHGPDKNRQIAHFERAGIVLTTYETATKSCLSSESILGRYFWFRIILDEAHHIRNTSTQVFSAVCSLTAQRRWCLTGTPIQNGLNDIFALTRFLRFEPFVSPKDIRSYITGPLSRHDELGLTNLRALMMVCSLRRLKNDLDLPAVDSQISLVALSNDERVQYDQVKSNLLLELSEAIKRGKAGTSIKTLAGIRKLRQICCHGLTTSTEALNNSKTLTSKRSICMKCGITVTGNRLSGTTQNPCGHTFCNACLATNAQTSDSALDGLWVCPACEQFGDALLADDCDTKLDLAAYDNDTEADTLAASRATSKMKAVLNALDKLHGDQANTSQPPTKSLVFTYWIRALDTIESGLKIQRIPYVRIDGQTPLHQRHEAISQFQTDPSCLVALLTLGTGSVGLNLTAASHVHLVEPHWNPMVEEQAAARAHRIGQTKQVTVHRYIVQNSIEERIRNKQHQKFHLAHLAGVGEDYVKRYDVGRQDVDELDSVFEKFQLL